MPRKSTKKSSVLDVPAPNRKRGRPRKPVAPEALTPFGDHEVPFIQQTDGLMRPSESVEVKASSRRMNPTTSDRHYTSEEVEFMNALAEFKRISGRTFPTCSEILAVLRQLGYEKAT